VNQTPSRPPAAPPTPLPPVAPRSSWWRALVPFAVFLAGVTWLALAGAPDETGLWVVLVGAIVVGVALAPDRAAWCDTLLDGMSQRMVLLMVCAWLFAGVLGAVLSQAGLVQALATVAQRAELGAGAFTAMTFVACCLLSTATGTSFGTILVAGPLLYPAGAAVHAVPAVLAGAILAGATFGDSISPISDTSIASSGTQQVDLGGTVRARLKYVVPAGLLALVVLWWLASRGAHTGVFTTTNAATSASLLPLVLLVVPVLVVARLIRGAHLIEALLTGVVLAAALGLLTGDLSIADLAQLDAANFTVTGAVVTGMKRAVGVSVFTLLLSGLVATVRAAGVLDGLVAFAQRAVPSRRGTEAWIVALASMAVVLTTHSVVAMLAIGDLVHDAGARAGIDGYRRANLMDLTVCTWPFLLPFFLPTILTASMTRGAAGAMPALTPGTIGVHNMYAWALLLMLVVMIAGGLGRTAPTRTRVDA
jgi:Na+/H+ antiporter NhaC